eukprot:TRINITY_DN62062_c0_g1_i1.p1 TRINITY_DN62062_c0_g1~~TRINITY_DN62062_c0_g1_i1.p1  ORF type:complete len:160 (-),score=26.44 TRINITY_DN62062_c0_g1_i1:120-533(-)
MLRAKTLEVALRQALGDGVTNIMLVDDGGSLVAAARSEDGDGTVAAIITSIYNDHKATEQFVEPGNTSKLQTVLFDCEKARVACTSFIQDGHVLLCACGDTNVEYGVLLNKLEIVKNSLQCLDPIFAQISALRFPQS